MVNQIYRIPLHGGKEDSKLDFWVCATNELNPYRQTKELAVTVIGEPQLDAMLDLESIDPLIKYLTDCREFIKKINDNSKPEPNE